MPQELIYVRRNKGVAKRSGDPYDFIEVSNGISSFTLTNGVGDELDELSTGDKFDAFVHVETVFGSLRGRIVQVVTQ